MSDIIQQVSLQVNKGFLSQTLLASGVTANMAASGILQNTYTPGTNAAGTAAIATTTLTACGMFFARNLSTISTAAVSFGAMNAGAMVPTIKLRGGECATGRLSPASYSCQSNLTGTQLLIVICEE